MIGPISLEAKQMGARSAGNPHAACDAEGAGNVARPRYWDTRRRKGEPTGETNFGLNRRASPRPYLRARGGATPLRDSPGDRLSARRGWEEAPRRAERSAIRVRPVRARGQDPVDRVRAVRRWVSVSCRATSPGD